MRMKIYRAAVLFLLVLLPSGLLAALSGFQQAQSTNVAVAIIQAVRSDIKSYSGNEAEIRPGKLYLDATSFGELSDLAPGPVQHPDIPPGLSVEVTDEQGAGVAVPEGLKIKDNAVFVVLESLETSGDGYTAVVHWLYNTAAEMEDVSCRILELKFSEKSNGRLKLTDKTLVGMC